MSNYTLLVWIERIKQQRAELVYMGGAYWLQYGGSWQRIKDRDAQAIYDATKQGEVKHE
jgi:hypothetical protein